MGEILIVLSFEEAEQLHRFMKREYVSRSNYPALLQLFARVDAYLTEKAKAEKE